MKILVTGAAGFIGMHLSRRLLERGDEVIGLDNLNDYYPIVLKQARLKELEEYKEFRFIKGDIADRDMLPELFEREQFDAVMNLAAQ
ncbi:MAG: SDR family NAD(P)-dependent oxidoreductase, partial [Prevotella sp.]|nr:SDR family NAD(P)-dependent oxidoreductase [Prevotella sp.]